MTRDGLPYVGDRVPPETPSPPSRGSNSSMDWIQVNVEEEPCSLLDDGGNSVHVQHSSTAAQQTIRCVALLLGFCLHAGCRQLQ